MKPRCILFTMATILFAISCGKPSQEEDVKPEIKIPTESQAVFSSGITFPEYTGTSAQTSTVSFTATEAWNADVADTKASGWLSVQPSSGAAGAVTMTVSAQPNPTTAEREAVVTIQCGTATQKFSVKQAGLPKVESMTLDKTELALVEGDEYTLTATILPDNAVDKTVTWSSSNAEVATVEQGKVKALKKGTATITAKAGDQSATCEVTVTDPKYNSGEGGTEEFGNENGNW